MAAAERLDALHVQDGGELAGIELHDASAGQATRLVAAAGRRAEVKVGDFFTFDPQPRYDAVVGNPPYVRYQEFTGESRDRGLRAAEAAGVLISNLASSWAAFTVHSALFLRPGGRLGLVLPAELLTVNYAAEVRRFLMERFARVRLVLFTERVFPGVLEEVVLLLADGYGQKPAGVCELYQVRNAEDLGAATGVAHRWTPETRDGKWSASLLSPEAARAYSSAIAKNFTRLETWGDTTLGMVTGNNSYFAMSPARAAALGLPPRELLPISPPGSKHLRGLTLTSVGWGNLGRDGASTLLFRPQKKPSGAALAYILARSGRGRRQRLQVQHPEALVVESAARQARRPATDVHERRCPEAVSEPEAGAPPQQRARGLPEARVQGAGGSTVTPGQLEQRHALGQRAGRPGLRRRHAEAGA